MLSTFLFLVVLMGSCTPQQAEDFILLTLEAIAERQDRLLQKMDEQRTMIEEQGVKMEMQQTMMQEQGVKMEIQQSMMQELHNKLSLIEVQVEEVQKCATHTEIDAFKDTFVTEQEEVKNSLHQCSTKDQIITFQHLLNANECEEGNHTCSTSATCTDTLIHFKCSCMSGYMGDGFTCQDVDECGENSTNNCRDDQICINHPGNYSCTCPKGYKNEGNICQDVDECGENSTNDCRDDEICINHPGNYSCTCPTGYKIEGNICQDMDECGENSTNDCRDDENCINYPGNYSCTCPTGYKNEGNICQDDPCVNPFFEIVGVGCIYVTEESHTWHSAQSHCRSKGGDLFVAENTTHFLALGNYLQNHADYFWYMYFWIGVIKRSWLDGRQVAHDEWNGTPSGDCAPIDSKHNYLLVNLSCTKELPFPICQKGL